MSAIGGSPAGAATSSGGGSGVGGTGAGGGSVASSGSGGKSTGGASGTASTGGGTAGMPGNGGAPGTGGSIAGAPASGAAGSGQGSVSCNFTVKAQTADKAGAGGIPTVGIVNWSVDVPNLKSASIAFGLEGAAPTLTAPVDVTTAPNFRSLLLGMKGSKTYTFHIEVSDGTASCTSPDYSITTGAVPNAVPRITRTAGPAVAAQAKGFIVASSGAGAIGGGMMGGGTSGNSSYAFILDADGDPVWFAPGPVSCTRAKMSVDGQYMWMIEVNVDNMTKDGGEVRRVSMDGLTTVLNIPGLANCHHDLTVLPNGKIACLSWIQQSGDQPSDLFEADADGNITKIVTLDSKVYLGGQGMGGGNSYHANSIHYHPADDSFTISDRNPSVFFKLNHQGQILWQFGGSCTGAPAPKCIAGDWKVNHGHDMLDDGTFSFFNNGQSGASTALFYKLTETGTFAAQKLGSYAPGTTSAVLGDVERLPNGNTIVAFSNAGVIHEIDPSGALVQSISGPGGYADWRETLYGPPPRF
jgi:hypothetical protein